MLATPSVMQAAELRRQDLLNQAARERQISQVQRATRSVRASERSSFKISLASAVTTLQATFVAGLLPSPEGVEAR